MHTASSKKADARAPVVVVGAGLSGLVLALRVAAEQPVILLAKRNFEEAATAWAQGGIVGVLGDDDSIEQHVLDTQEAGAGLVHEETARFMAQHSAEAIAWLVAQGVPFSPDPQGPLGLHLTREGGHAVRRIAHAADATGKAIHDVLLKAVREHGVVEALVGVAHHRGVLRADIEVFPEGAGPMLILESAAIKA
jgi:L-aspartate oxidase